MLYSRGEVELKIHHKMCNEAWSAHLEIQACGMISSPPGFNSITDKIVYDGWYSV